MLSAVTKSAVSLSPASVSPVLKQDLTITMDPLFPDINKNDYMVFIRNSAANYERELYITNWDNINKEMTVKFNGAPSDTYVVYVKGPMAMSVDPDSFWRLLLRLTL